MKKIQENVWKNYISEPSKIQKAWIQRWFELLDTNSSIIISLPQVSLKTLIKELYEIEVDKKTRDIAFVLCEIKEKITNGLWFEDANYELRLNDLKHEIEILFDKSAKLYDEKGNKISLSNWKEPYDDFRSDLTKFRIDFSYSSISHYFVEETYLEWLFNNLKIKLLNDGNNLKFNKIDTTTQEILIFLLEKDFYSNSYLKNKCKQYFLKKNDLTFSDRLNLFIKDMYILPEFFTVYMQIQNSRDLIIIRKFQEINVILDLHNEIKEMETQNVSSDMARIFKYFLYHGDYPNNKIFIKIKKIRACDAETALQIAENQVAKFLNVLKFEYYARNICVTNKVLIRNENSNNIVILNRNILSIGKSHVVGDPMRAERIANQVSMGKFVNLKELALYWYNQAIESKSPETQFLNYWICLEQIFKKSITNESSGDKLVRTVGKKLSENKEILDILNFWGDIYRVGIFNPNRIKVSFKGRVLYDENLNSHPRVEKKLVTSKNVDSSNFAIIEITEGSKKSVRIQPNSVIFIDEGNIILRGQWLSGRFLSSEISNNFFREIFKHQCPSLNNIFYLQYYSYYIKNQFIVADKCIILDNYLDSFESLLKAINWFQENELEGKFDKGQSKDFILNSSYYNYHDEYEKLIEIRNYIMNNWNKIPDDFILEAFRNDFPFRNNLTIPKEYTISAEQTLLNYRLIDINSQTKVSKNSFYASMDRIRRVRNDLVHEAKTDYNISLFSIYLAKVTRHYLQVFFKNSTSMKYNTMDEIINGKNT